MELAAFVVAEWRRDARLDAVRVANTAREGAYAACEANIARRVACGRVRSVTTSQEGGFHFQVLGHRRRTPSLGHSSARGADETVVVRGRSIVVEN